MAAKAQNLIAERVDRDALVLVAPLAPFFPGIAAAPSSHDQNAIAISALHERFVFELAFEPAGVEAHLFHVAEFRLAARLVDAQHHVRRPTSAAHKHGLAVYFEQAEALGSQFGIGFDDSEGDGLPVRWRTFLGNEFERELMKIWLAHLIRPPQAGILNVQRS